MKKLLILFCLLISVEISNAQIAEVKQDGKTVKVFDDNGSLKGTTQICSSCYLGGFSSKTFVVVDGNNIKIFNHNANYRAKVNNTGSFDNVNVTNSYIILTIARKSYYYDFDGRFVKSN